MRKSIACLRNGRKVSVSGTERDGTRAGEDSLGEVGRDQTVLRLLGHVQVQAIVVVDSM